MKRLWILALFLECLPHDTLLGQVTGNFVVKGNEGVFYPVLFFDGGSTNNVATDVQIGRSWVHTDSLWRGSMIADFKYHTNNWGNGAGFINADVREFETHPVTISNFIGGWSDISLNNSNQDIVIWLKGGTTTYYYTSNYAVNPTVYDGVQNALPYSIPNGGTVNSKSVADSYVNTNGGSTGGSLLVSSTLGVLGGSSYNQLDVNSDLNAQYQFVAGGSSTGNAWAGKMVLNYSNYGGSHPRFTVDSLGNVGIGTQYPQSLLAVAGNITAKQVTVSQTGWSDFVFDSGYHRMPLSSVALYAAANKHLPDIPSAGDIQRDGLDLGTMEKLHMQKIEELTLYAIDEEKRVERDEALIAEQRALLIQLSNKVDAYQKEVSKLKSQTKKHHTN